MSPMMGIRNYRHETWDIYNFAPKCKTPSISWHVIIWNDFNTEWGSYTYYTFNFVLIFSLNLFSHYKWTYYSMKRCVMRWKFVWLNNNVKVFNSLGIGNKLYVMILIILSVYRCFFAYVNKRLNRSFTSRKNPIFRRLVPHKAKVVALDLNKQLC